MVSAAYVFSTLDDDVSGFGVEGAIRAYLSGRKYNAPRGWFLSPNIHYGHAKNSETKDSGNIIAASFGTGYQWVWESGLTLDLGIGLGYISVFGFESDEDNDSGLIIPLEFGIGYNF